MSDREWSMVVRLNKREYMHTCMYVHTLIRLHIRNNIVRE
jgi:hypothetical protein